MLIYNQKEQRNTDTKGADDMMNRHELQNRINNAKKERENARKNGDSKGFVFWDATLNIYTQKLEKITR